jgi:hypothetical protein
LFVPCSGASEDNSAGSIRLSSQPREPISAIGDHAFNRHRTAALDAQFENPGNFPTDNVESTPMPNIEVANIEVANRDYAPKMRWMRRPNGPVNLTGASSTTKMMHATERSATGR